MFNWKYYSPFIILFLGLVFFIHFSWLPNYIDYEEESMIKQEEEYLSVLGKLLLPSLLSGDLEAIMEDLDNVVESRKGISVIELYSKNGNQIYPLSEIKNIMNNHHIKIHSIIQQDGIHHGQLVTILDIDELLGNVLSKIKNLELLLGTIFFFFITIAIFLQYIWVKRPIKDLMIATGDVAQGKYDSVLPKKLSGDLFEFVTSFDQMRAMLKYRETKIIRQHEIQVAVQDIQSFFISSQDRQSVFNKILSIVLKITNSKFGFIGEIFYDSKKQPILETYAVSNIAWDVESRMMYEKSIDGSMTFTNTNTLFGHVMVTGQPLISNDPINDSKAGGLPPGHPVLTRFMGIPIYNRKSKFMGMVGVANCDNNYIDTIIDELSIVWLAIGNLMDAYNEQVLLSNNEQKLRAVVDNAVEGIITIDESGLIETFNTAAESIFGYSSNEIIGHNVKILMPEDIAIQHDGFLKSYLGGGKAKIIGIGREVEGLRKSGEIFSMELSIAEIKTDSMRRFTGIVRDITERKIKENELMKAKNELAKANLQLETLVRTDGLTQISNRRHFDEILLAELNRASRQQYHLALLMFDIDHFKKYNDYYGHTDGDKCLKRVAQTTLSTFQRSGDLVARYGGEEFSVILSHADLDTAKKLAEVLLNKINDLKIEHRSSPTEKHVTISIGAYSLIPEIDTKPGDLIRHADKALYIAKNNGRNQIVTFPSSNNNGHI